jgi:hypothetical protein
MTITVPSVSLVGVLIVFRDASFTTWPLFNAC